MSTQAQGQPHDPQGSVEPGEHDDEDELFPRVLTTRLVADEEAARERRQSLQAWAVGGGLGLIALGTPRAVHGMLETWSTPGPRAAAHWLAERLDMAREPLGFLTSAIFLALSLPAIVRALRRIGFEYDVALPCALTAVLSPLGWVRATTACDFYAGVFVAALLLDELASARRGPRALALYGLGVLLHAEVLLYLPAIVIAHRSVKTAAPGKAPAGKTLGWTVGRTALVGGLLAVLALVQEALAGGPAEFRPGQLLWPFALGLAALGLVRPWMRSSQEIERPPAWFLAFLLTPLAGLAFAGVGQGAWLVPLAAAGLADRAQGLGRERFWHRGWGLFALQLALTVGIVSTRPAHQQDSIERAARELEATDLVICDSRSARYYFTERWNLEVLSSDAPDLVERVRAALAEGRRVVVNISSVDVTHDLPPELGESEEPPYPPAPLRPVQLP